MIASDAKYWSYIFARLIDTYTKYWRVRKNIATLYGNKSEIYIANRIKGPFSMKSRVNENPLLLTEHDEKQTKRI